MGATLIPLAASADVGDPSKQSPPSDKGVHKPKVKVEPKRKPSSPVLVQPSTSSSAASPVVGAKPAIAGTTPARPAEDGESPTLALEVIRHTIKNGLRVVLCPDHTVPTVAIAVYYDVGSRNETTKRSGFAHLFEHMMFQGSKNVAKGEHFKLVMNRGGSMNGTTSVDRTNYYETLPSNELELGLWLEADRMRSLKITQENFENQRQTVMEERRQSYDNQPYMNSMLRINEIAYGKYWPYAHSTIGDMKDLQEAPLSAVQDFYRTYYAPNNAVLSVAGDFSPTEIMKLVKRYFGDIPSQKLTPFKEQPFEPPTQERYETIEDRIAELPAFHIAYPIPQARSADHYPLEILAVVLGGGESSRLYQTLVKEKEWAQEVEVAADGRRGPDLFSFWVVLSKAADPKKIREIIFKEIESIAKRGISKEELAKAKNIFRSGFVFGLESNISRAEHLGEFELYWKDASLLNTELGRYLDVNIDDIKRVAGRYFAPSTRSILDVIPRKKDVPENQLKGK